VSGPRLKQLVWAATLLVLVGGALLVVPLLGNLYGRLERAQVQNSALNLVQARHAEPGALAWEPDDPGLPRDMEPYARDAVTDGYRRGYEELAYALYSGETQGLPSYFQQEALDDARLVTDHTQNVEFADWDHQLTLHFYAPDGGTVAFTDTYLYAQGRFTDGAPRFARVARRTVDVQMDLDDGNWRVHHWRILTDTANPAPPPPRPALPALLGGIHGVNYEARSAPFSLLWTRFDPQEVDGDFRAARTLGFDTVRIFVPYPLPKDAGTTLNALLDAAGRRGLRVIPTLLDGYTRYRLADLPGILEMYGTLRPALERPEVLAIDLKNEADRDAPTAGWDRLRFFLTVLAEQVRVRSSKPLTVGTVTPDRELSRALDFVTVHAYGPPGELEGLLSAAERQGRPVLLEEFGYHTLGTALPDPHTEADQARHYAQVLRTVRGRGEGWMAWTLYDLKTGAVPGGRAVERNLGVLRADGSAKPVDAGPSPTAIREAETAKAHRG